ncbi:MAG: hypothetical protein QME96_13395, partial [Myxococcota bacterium]|nr:hypothetical protein [Myxococcota bacterium]
MLISHGLVCTSPSCGWSTTDATYEKGSGPPACPTCGSPTRISWSHGRAPAYTGTAVLHFGHGTSASRDAVPGIMARLRAMHPGKDFTIEADSPEAQKMRAEESRHRTAEQRRLRGVDAAAMVERDRIVRHVRSEAVLWALRENLDPRQAADEAAKQVPSATAIAGARETVGIPRRGAAVLEAPGLSPTVTV